MCIRDRFGSGFELADVQRQLSAQDLGAYLQNQLFSQGLQNRGQAVGAQGQLFGQNEATARFGLDRGATAAGINQQRYNTGVTQSNLANDRAAQRINMMRDLFGFGTGAIGAEQGLGTQALQNLLGIDASSLDKIGIGINAGGHQTGGNANLASILAGSQDDTLADFLAGISQSVGAINDEDEE